MEKSDHIWQFSRVGGVNRVNLESGDDLIYLGDLDQKLWTALSCPVHGLEIDSKTLEYIDSDKDDRIRAPEILEAIRWITSVINNADDLLKQNASLPLSAINEDSTEGKKLIASAKQILTNLGKSESIEISVEETSDTEKIFRNTQFNGDGIVTEESTNDADLKQLINEIISTIGSAMDRSGKAGISTEIVEDFFKNCEDYSAWQATAETNHKKILPFGDSTEDAFKAFNLVKSKVEDYFVRCQLSEFDSKSTDILNLLTAQVEAISQKDLTANMEEIASFPLSKIEANKPLSLAKGINPAWQKRISKFKRLAIATDEASKEALTEEEWNVLKEKFENYSNWKAEKGGELVEILGLEEVSKILQENKKEDLFALISSDKALENEANNIFLVDKLARYYRDLFTLLNNFVTFSDFYSPQSKAIFQVGTLYIDQRSCDLCIKVSDMAKHSSMAGSSGICLIYLDCFSKVKKEKMIIAVALTDGDIDNISLGRNAIFYDRKGLDWDATIIKIIENPISIRKAFWMPYKRVAKFISTQIEKFASAKDKEVNTIATSGIEKTTTKVDAGVTNSLQSTAAPVPPATPLPPFDIGKFAGIFAAIGLAFGAIGSVLTAFLGGFFGLVWWKMPLAIIGLILSISGPSMILAWLKLRKRNLAPVLDSNGWAINAKATINIQFGNTLTHIANLPKNSKQNLVDPFSKKKNPFWKIMIILIILLAICFYYLWHFGFLKSYGIF